MNRCFVLYDSEGNPGRVYFLSNNTLTLLQNTLIQFPVPPEADPTIAIMQHEQRTWPQVAFASQIVEKALHIGRYFPSIAKPVYPGWDGNFNPKAGEETELIKTIWRELEVLVQDLERCFDVNSPHDDNLSAFGIAYEKMLFFACIGIESLFRKILEDNGVGPERPNTAHFVKLEPHLRLREYEVGLIRYPWLTPIKPYQGWSSDSPSASLPWFDGYNRLKHDKRSSQSCASMQNALHALAAYYVLAYAVFGGQLFPGSLSDQHYFAFFAKPAWPVDEMYFNADDKSWTPMPLLLQ